MSLHKSILSAMVVVFGLTTSSQSFALSHGAEVVSLGVGAVSVSVGKAENNKALRYVGWGLISVGGTVVVGSGVFIIGAVFGAMFASMYSMAVSPVSSIDPNEPDHYYKYYQNKISILTEGSVEPTLDAAMKEVRAEVSLASNPQSDTREMVIQSVADAIGVDVHAFASDFKNYIRALKVSSEVDSSSIHCTQDLEKIKMISGLFSNYAKARAILAQ